jgi:hypothetical protein
MLARVGWKWMEAIEESITAGLGCDLMGLVVMIIERSEGLIGEEWDGCIF